MATFLVLAILVAVVAGLVLIVRGAVRTGAAILALIALLAIGSVVILNEGVSEVGHTGPWHIVHSR